MQLDFTLENIKNMALSIENVDYENNITSADAFFIVLKGLDYETIENLCVAVADKLKFKDAHYIYDFIQSDNCNLEYKQIVLDTAYELIHENKALGNKIINSKFNAASWISHSLYEGEAASIIASSMGLDSDTAKKLGILHDIGRKFDHKFSHTIKGYEYLILLGFKDEAVCCLTHSFLPININNSLKGNRCANCDAPLNGFYIDEHGNGVFKSENDKDDITLFLDNYNYNLYDIILNVADLMAMSKGIVSPYDRVLDVYTRKEPNPQNSPFFKICFINVLRKLLFYATNESKYLKIYNINDLSSNDDIEKLFIDTSNLFIKFYETISKDNKKTMNIS